MDAAAGKTDFFVSYNTADEEWAEWIAFQLEAAGYSVLLQKWDFLPGSNFVIEMDEASRRAERTIVVLSPAFLGSNFTPSEWAAAFSRDPRGLQRKLIPVVVSPITVDGLLGQIVHIDLASRDVDAAARLLLEGVRPGRAKPSTAPPFPGGSASAGTSFASPMIWQPWTSAEPMRWRDAYVPGHSSGGYAVIEVHLVPTTDALVPVRQLERAAGEFVAAGRTSGVFADNDGVGTEYSAEVATAITYAERAKEAGLMLTRDGRRGGWRTLPHDSLGGVLDPEDVGTTVRAILEAVLGIDAPEPARWAPGVAVTSALLLSVGSASDLGRRTSSSLRMFGDRIVSDPQDSVDAMSLRGHLTDVADEVVARIMASAR